MIVFKDIFYIFTIIFAISFSANANVMYGTDIVRKSHTSDKTGADVSDTKCVVGKPCDIVFVFENSSDGVKFNFNDGGCLSVKWDKYKYDLLNTDISSVEDKYNTNVCKPLTLKDIEINNRDNGEFAIYKHKVIFNKNGEYIAKFNFFHQYPINVAILAEEGKIFIEDDIPSVFQRMEDEDFKYKSLQKRYELQKGKNFITIDNKIRQSETNFIDKKMELGKEYIIDIGLKPFYGDLPEEPKKGYDGIKASPYTPIVFKSIDNNVCTDKLYNSGCMKLNEEVVFFSIGDTFLLPTISIRTSNDHYDAKYSLTVPKDFNVGRKPGKWRSYEESYQCTKNYRVDRDACNEN
jgi:hypothetical protein